MNYLKQATLWLAGLLVPVILVLLGVRLLLTPVYIQAEYRLPGFPADPYGFTFEERLVWADVSREYLLNRAGIEFLGERELEPGTPLYNERELRHMLDVKVVVKWALGVLYGSLAFVAAAGFWARKTGWGADFRLALARGGWLTVGLIVAVLAYLAINFDALFVKFHQIFFEGETWIFEYSDTLIRLFPLQFWRDAFIWIGALALGGGAALGYFGGRRTPAPAAE